MSDERVELERLPVAEDEAPLLRPAYPRSVAGYDSSPYGYGYGDEDERGSAYLRDLWRMVRKRKWLIISVTVIITTLVTIEAYRTKSIYKASAFIELGKDSPAVRPGPSNVVIQPDDEVFFPQLAINTHLFRLSSEPLLADVVARLKLDQNPRFKEPPKTTFMEAVEAIAHRAGMPQAQDQGSSEVSDVIESWVAAPRTQEETERLGAYVGMIAGALQADQVKDTRTLRVTFSHTDPHLTAIIANNVAQHFIDTSFENKTEKFTSASKWLDETTRKLKAKVEQAEQDLADYSKSHNIFSLEGKETLTTEKMTRLHEHATRAETERIVKQSAYEEVKAGRASQLPAAYSDQRLITLQSKLEELEATAAKLSVKYGPDNPQMVDIRQQIATAKSQLESNRRGLEDKLKSEYEMALNEERSLKTALDKSKGEAVEQNQAAIQYNILKQEVDTAKSMYTDFLQKTSQAQLEVAQQHNTMRLVQPARAPSTPVGPARFRIIMMGFLMSLLGGVGLAYFLQYLDNSIKTVEDVGRYIRLPALGVIPTIGARQAAQMKSAKRKQLKAGANGNGVRSGLSPAGRQGQSLAALDSRSSVAEAYRVVRTSMLLSAAGRPPKTILVTSGQAGEGKTTTVVNTAISLAQLGASVLIIDCDLRRPSAHKLFGLDHKLGLSTYLSREAEIDPLIQKLQIANLSLLACGPIPPNPAELISSVKMRHLIREMSERFDHVLIDSPPLINVTDPVILSSMVDGVILVVQGGKSTRAIAARARQELATVGAKIFGVVLNNVDLRADGYDYYYYNRYYTNYGVTEEERV